MPANIVALDYGAARVGVALADDELKLSRPLQAIGNDQNLTNALVKLIDANQVAKLVVGLPRSLDGNDTAQTKQAREFAQLLKRQLNLPVYLVDEAGTSVEAEARLKTSGRPYDKADIDSLAAALILDNFLSNL